jgi:hypothetical protein
MQGSMWGVSTGGKKRGTEHITFTVRVGHGEEYIAQRLFRERRVGRVGACAAGVSKLVAGAPRTSTSGGLPAARSLGGGGVSRSRWLRCRPLPSVVEVRAQRASKGRRAPRAPPSTAGPSCVRTR